MPDTARPLCITPLGPLRENGRIARCHLDRLSIGCTFRLDVDPRTKSHGRIHTGGGCSVHRTITRHGWRVVSAHGWLERVRRTEHPSPAHHPKSAREDPNR